MAEQEELARKLTHRHIQMIALGGTIGTGLFLGAGSAIHQAGPAILLAYAIGGFFCYLMMRALGELLLSDLKKTSFLEFVQTYLGQRAGFVVGWLYWLCWLSLAMADLTATGIYLHYWFPSLPQWVAPLVIIGLLVGINLLSVGAFGELEYWFSMIKVITIIALIACGVGLLVSGLQLNGHTASLKNLWQHGGFFATGWHGLLTSFTLVIFAFTGIEMLGLTAGETANPAKELPRAINSLPLRMILFYVGALFAMMIIYPWNQLSTTSSPFVQVFSGLGIKAAASVINFVVLTAAVSAANSALFSTSRTLFVLAHMGGAPKRMGVVNKYNVPKTAMLSSAVVLLITVGLNYVLPDEVFTIVASVSTINFIFVWLVLIVCHLIYRRTHAKNQNFAMPLFPLTDWLTLAFFGLVLVGLCLDPTRWWLVASAVGFAGCLWLISYAVIK
ncbi:amino acid permease [Furfurilactobacillus siliginis]|nr:amino acid permease [Furfurilactobacillus siliginis]GEK29122.1 amino acid permease [Furfurilactobacillus siliginis]